MIIFLILVVVIFGLFFTGKSGMDAAEQAAVDDQPVRRAISHGQTGCMGILFCIIGMIGVLMIISIAFPGK